ncbi:hypothetical protein HY493_01440 [Candidatus Woesearchaeota archaeon]|nr:hypothetical protein [Candidatus Woesearchaeota archaeon]
MKGGLLVVLVAALVFIAACGGQGATGGALQIRTTELPQWEAPGAATYKLDVVGGVPPYTFSGTLPDGFNLGPDGTIGGMARLSPGTSKSESPPFTITVTDSAGAQAQVSLTIRLIAANTLQLITVPATCILDQQCDEEIATASGGNPPYGFQSDTFREGAPPFGTIIDINGHIVGKPSRAGEYTMGVCVTDKLRYQQCGHVVVTVEEGIQLEGTWIGAYGETETSEYCITSNEGTLTLALTEKDGAFSGTVDDSGVSSATSQSSSDVYCEGGSYHLSGTVSGTIEGDTLSGAMRVSDADLSYELPFTATLTTDTMTGSYSGIGTFEGGSSQISAGSFRLTKKT